MALTLILSADRKLRAIENDDFRLTLNGKSNAEYKAMLAYMGIRLLFQEEAKDGQTQPATPPTAKGTDLPAMDAKAEQKGTPPEDS